MTVEINEATRNTMVDSIGTVLDSGFIDFYTGSQPADPDDAPTGLLLVSCQLAADAYAAASGGSAAINGVASGIAVDTGTAGYARQRDSVSGNSMYGSVSLTGMGGDVEMTTLSIVAGNVVNVNTSTLSVPES